MVAFGRPTSPGRTTPGAPEQIPSTSMRVSGLFVLCVLAAGCVDRRDAVSVEVVMTAGATAEEQGAVQAAAAGLTGAGEAFLDSLPCAAAQPTESSLPTLCPVVVRFDVPDEATAREAADVLGKLANVQRVDVTVT